MLNEGRPVAVGGFGVQGSPPEVEVVNGGYQFNLDLFTDKLMPVLAPLARRLESVGLPLRTVEHESGPGQIELTFSPMSGLAAADAVLLIRVLTKQVCDRLGYHASFMALPGIPGLDPNGWHLHQSLYDVGRGRNVFAADDGESALSETGRHYLAGLLAHAADISMLCVPTVNGYRRLADDYSLSPDRVVWSVENRGSFLRVCGSPGEPSTHLENRVGEPCANPYLAIAAQLAAGLDGVDSTLDPGAMATAPHDPRSRRLPRSLADALTALETGRIGREVLGEPLWRALVRLKRSEWDRFRAWAASNGVDLAGGKASEWEHREYFDVF
jgi:glutamine synthetase